MTNVNGTDFVSFVATGKDRSGKRFSIRSKNWLHITGINIWNGNKWGIMPNGKRKLITRVSN